MTTVAVAGVPCASAATSTPGGVADSSATNAMRTVTGHATCPNGSMSTATTTNASGHGTTSVLSPLVGSLTTGIMFGISVIAKTGRDY
eukprot:8110363-Pyramimonas_sp.AAC.1